MDNNEALFRRNRGIYPTQGTPKLDPFLNARGNPLDPVLPTSPEIVERIKNTYNDAVPIIMPRTMAAPEGARTIDQRKVIEVAAGATVDLMSLIAKAGATTVIFAYALFTDETGFPALEWYPTIDGQRVLQFHGDPSTNPVSMNLSTSFGGSVPEMVPCQIIMEPGQIFLWRVRNGTGSPVNMGVRMRGYLDMSQRLTATKFGD